MAATTELDRLLAALRARGASIRKIRYRENRTVLLSLSRDGRTLNCHAAFQAAPARIIDAIALFVRSRRGSEDYRRALARIRGWDGARKGLERARRRGARHAARILAGPPTPEAAAVGRVYRRFNRTRFGGHLPEVPIRISRRMRRSLGTISYGGRGADRRVREIAISADLLVPANVAILEDTLLHEMAHAEAWLRHGHRGHGSVWRAIAERVGCTPRALIHTRVRGRR
ncbi:MAG TPA: SprT-like domain-containing protein [Longimicrobiales bacterium]|nr:SprT-like domain-containing protein [Longimicrobiales bacterium]